jgi:hypothetical protein
MESIMSHKIVNALTQTILAAAMVAAVGATADTVTNPLHPAYYSSRSNASVVADGNGTPYADTRNPRHPSYAHGTQNVRWETTGTSTTQAYFDARNPLHPRFQR